jgi:hypothetical protein
MNSSLNNNDYSNPSTKLKIIKNNECFKNIMFDKCINKICGYLYILHYKNDKYDNVYKIGKTTQTNINDRVKQYSKAYNLKKYIYVSNCHIYEKEIIKKFKKKFKKYEKGNEYFIGDLNVMNDMYNTIYEEDLKKLNEKLNHNSNAVSNNIPIINQKGLRIYKCNICKLNFRDNYNYNRHINTIKHKNKIQDVNLNKINNTEDTTLLFSTKEQGILHKLKKGNKQDNYNCDFCNTTIKNKTNLRKHLQISCIHITNKLKNVLISQHNSRKNTKHKLELIVKTNTNNTNVNNSDPNNININTNTNINANTNILKQKCEIINTKNYMILNYIGTETINHITLNDCIDILDSNNIIKTMWDKIYTNKSNYNIYFCKDNKCFIYLNKVDEIISYGSIFDINYIIIIVIIINFIKNFNIIHNKFHTKLSHLNLEKLNKFLKCLVNINEELFDNIKNEFLNKIYEISIDIKDILLNSVRVYKNKNINFYVKN